MAAILRVRARWSGYPGSPGFTVMHFRDFGTGDGGGVDPDQGQAEVAGAKVRTFFEAIKTMLPSAVTVGVEPVIDMIEDTTGELVDSFSTAGYAPTVGGNAGSFSSAVGAVVNWRTNGIRNGRRVRGRTFLVPLAGGILTTQGSIAPSSVATIQTAADALAVSTGTPDLGVYARPTAVGATDGAWFVTRSATVPVLSAVLRSRRD